MVRLMMNPKPKQAGDPCPDCGFPVDWYNGMLVCGVCYERAVNEMEAVTKSQAGVEEAEMSDEKPSGGWLDKKKAPDPVASGAVPGQAPSVGRIVHYVAFGTPGGEYPSNLCRAAIMTTAGASSGIGEVVGEVALCIFNPTGLHFRESVPQDERLKQPGTWHWPERV
jgi:hypothetical protein